MHTTFRRMRFGAAMVLAVVFPGFVAAQQPAGGARSPDPVPTSARAEESWSAAPPGSGALRRLKHVSVRSDDRAWVTLGGSLRLRGIDTRDFNFSDAPVAQDDYTEWRTLVSADAWVGRREGWHGRAFVEWRDAQGFGRTLPGGVRPSEADRADWQAHFIEVGRGRTGLRIGRQDVAIGRERLVGVADWSNSRRTFEGGRFLATIRRVQVDAFDGSVVDVRINDPDRADSNSRLSYVAATLNGVPAAAGAWRLAGAQLYLLRAELQAGLSRRVTTGGRAWWDRRARATDWAAEVEAATQAGDVGPRDVRAWFGVAEGTVTWRDVRFAPAFTAAMEIGSGSGADSARRIGAFAPPYATAHGHNGFADVFGRGNLLERRVGASARPHRTVLLSVLARHFSRVRLEDGAWTKSNVVLRTAGASTSRDLGDELDFNVSWIRGPHVRVQGGASWVVAGDFIRETGPAAPVRWAFLSTTVIF